MSRHEITQGTNDDVRRNLELCARNISRIVASIPVKPIDDFVGVAVVKLAAYAIDEIRGAANFGLDIKLMAWRTRNIFETFLLMAYCNKSVEHANEFAAQKIKDEAVMLSRFVGSVDDERTNLIRERIDLANKVLGNHGFPNIKDALPWNLDVLAKDIGVHEEYKAFYKPLSKYVHPSAWITLSDVDETQALNYWEMVKVKAQLYAHLCRGEALHLLEALGGTVEQETL